MRKFILSLTMVLLALLLLPVGLLEAASVDTSYTYDYWGNELAAPDAFRPAQVIRGTELGIGRFNSPADVYAAPNEQIYILDSGNRRIVVLDEHFDLLQVIDRFENHGVEDTFSAPEGIFVDADGMIYVADTGNGRIVHLAADGSFIREFGRPESDLIDPNFVYQPTKLVLDRAKRIYVIARNVNQGIIELDIDGGFTAFIGAVPVQPNIWDYVWKRLSTQAQREGMVSFVPTEQNNIDIDDSGFLYVTSGTTGIMQWPVRRLNLTGDDIMRRNGAFDPIGDLNYLWVGDGPTGPSTLIDVTSHDETNSYSVLDRKRGRIFTYDQDGNLLYIYGNLSDQVGMFRAPSAIASYRGGLLVSDTQTHAVTFLEPTTYAATIQAALSAHHRGDYDQAADHWSAVLDQNSNSELAYIGLGRTLMRQDDFDAAMHNFRLGNHRSYYSDAFQLNLKDVVREHLLTILIVIAAIIAAVVLAAKYKHKILRDDIPVLGGLNYAFYVIFHPFDGFYDLKHEKRGNAASATIIYVLLVITMILRRQLTGFVFNMNNPLRLNVMTTIITTLLPYFIWILANWALTTLMDGKGTIVEIYTATGYALFPMVLINLPLIPLSHIMTEEQGAFYSFFIVLATVWSYALIFFGTMITHEYSLGKNIAVTIFTFVGMGLILFIGLLIFDLSGQMVNFVRAIVKEVQFRL